MATFKVCVFDHQKRSDGKYPVSIRVYWKKQKAYIGTEFYVTEKQLSKKTLKLEGGEVKKTLELKDAHIINELNRRIVSYEDIKVKKLGYNIELYTARELAEYLKKESAPGTDSSINFIEFAELHCERLVENGKKKTAQTLKTPVNALIDFCNGRKKIYITEITTKFLQAYEKYLRSERILKRKNQFGNDVITKRKGLSDVGVHDYMTAIRILFYAAMDEYNDEDRDEVRIKHNPFRKYKVEKVPESEKRVLSIDEIRKIKTVTDLQLKYPRNILARDMFMLSFYLAGTNLADFYYAEASALSDGRFSYDRQKTKDRRKDSAYISILIQPEAVPIIEKYKDPTGERAFIFHKMYTDHNIFLTAVNKGLEKVAEACGINDKVTTYYARFSLATIARNECEVPKDDINMLLNHVDLNMKITDIYIKKDWSKIDNAIRLVIDLLVADKS